MEEKIYEKLLLNYYDYFLLLLTSIFLNVFLVCNGLGIGELAHVLSINATNIGSFENCTKINGNIAIIYTSING